MNVLAKLIKRHKLPAAAKQTMRRDRELAVRPDPGIEASVKEGIAWLGRAQDHSASADGGVARDYSLVNGWATSYPETTGYIIPTMLEYGHRYGDQDAITRAQRMLDWLVSIQLPGGGFQGGVIGATPVVPVTFNTGQILFGLAAGVKEFGDAYRAPMTEAAVWLRDSLDDDGCWRKHATPFAKTGDKTYETHVAWALLEADRVAPDNGYGEAGLTNIRWAIGNQQANGWLADCCLNKADIPLTHTLGYALRGILEAYEFSKDQQYLDAGIATADGLLSAINKDGYLPGRLDRDWNPAVEWVCLTGSVQIAICWLMLHRYTGNDEYKQAALAANAYVRRTMDIDGPDETRGAIKGSHPVDGDYGRFQYLNWACKFFIDANLLELDLQQAS